MIDDYFDYQRREGAGPADRRLLSDFTEEDWTHFTRFTSRRSYQPGERILTQASTDRALYIILSGSVDVVMKGLMSTRKVARIESGSLFGELAFFDEQPRSADVIANDATDVLILDREAFDRFSAWYPRSSLKLTKGIARILSERIRRTNIDV